MQPRLEEPPKVSLLINETCNLECLHCYADCNRLDRRPQLRTEEWLRFIDYLYEKNVVQLYIEGGEPFVRDDIWQILEYCSRKFMTLLRTHGTLLDAPRAQRLKEIGVGRIYVDLMGARAESHEFFTGVAGSFEKSREAIGHLSAAGVRTDALVILTRQNAGELQEIAELAHNQGALRLGILRLYPLGRTKHRWQEFALSLEDQVAAIQRVKPPSGLEVMQSWHPKDHNCCWQSATVNAYGDSIGCSYLREYVNYGSIKATPFFDIWHENALYKKIRSGKVEQTCSSCHASDNTSGGCRSTAYAFHGRWEAPDPFCSNLNKGVDLRVLPDWVLQENPKPPSPSGS
jgi:radical SAM protein with 4Fe4S-binding SPASM domain